MSQEAQPRRTVGARCWLVMEGEDPADQVLINRHSENQVDLIGNLGASPGRITVFVSTTVRITSAPGPLGPGFVRRFGENNIRYLH